MASVTSLSPISTAEFGPAQARHLAQRAGFGGSFEDVQMLLRMGPIKAVDYLVDYQQVDVAQLARAEVDPNVIRPLSEQERKTLTAARKAGNQDVQDRFREETLKRRREDYKMIRELQQWWLQRMVQTPRPMEEKLTLLWHGHFATRYRNVRDAYLMYQQNAMFRKHANGSFADLAFGIVRDPAMIRFLNNDRNVSRKPNENLARELMELFTLGEGNYTEKDIKEAARALTGYHAQDNDFVLRERAHDEGEKRILGKRGDFDGDSLVLLLLRQSSCLRFITMKLYRHLVADVSDKFEDIPRAQQGVIDQLALQLRKNEYDLAPMLKTLLRSRHFYSSDIMGKKIKSPVQLAVGSMRMLGTPDRNWQIVQQALVRMGQTLFDPPSVAGWDIGRSWVNTSTLFVRQNLCTYLITGKDPARGGWVKDRMNYDPVAQMAGMPIKTPETTVDFWVDTLLGPHVPAARRQPLVSFMQQRDKGVTQDSVVALLLLITAMPEYQLC